MNNEEARKQLEAIAEEIRQLRNNRTPIMPKVETVGDMFTVKYHLDD